MTGPVSFSEIQEEFKLRLAQMQPSREKVDAIIEFTIIYGDSFPEQMETLLQEALAVSNSIGFNTGLVICNYNLMFFRQVTRGDQSAPQAAQLGALAMTLETVPQDDPWYPYILSMIAYYHWFRGEYDKGFDTIFRALKHSESNPNNIHGWNCFALGVFYFDTWDYSNARLYYGKAREVFEARGYVYGSARAMTGLGTVAINQDNMTAARDLLEGAAVIYRRLGHLSGLSRAVNDIAVIEKATGNLARSVELFTECIRLRTQMGHTQGLITSFTELGEIYLQEEKLHEALAHFGRALHLAEKAHARQKEMRLHKLVYLVHKKSANVALALKHFELYDALKVQLMGDEANNKIKKLQTQFEKEKSEQEAEIERLKNVELKKAYQIIEQRNKDIHDSIHYASRIQRSLLPTDRIIKKMLESLRRRAGRA
jgi:tetratricopeptide (TPR) repeat protein